MPLSTHASTLRFIGSLVIGIGIFALVMVITGTHISHDPEVPTLDSSEEARQELAVHAQQIADMSDGNMHSTATEWVSALGGVWVPWPQGAPEGQANPQLPTASYSTLPAALSSFANEALTSSAGPTAVAIGISAYTQSVSSAEKCGTYDLLTVGRALSNDAAVENIEIARQWLEIPASHMQIGQRDLPLARIALLSALLDAQIASGGSDTRPALAPPPSHDPLTDSYDVLTQQLSLAAQQAPATDRQHIASFVCHLYHDYPDAPPIAALPGLVRSSN
ncbi:hypothetical protein [Trueperella sp. LYQ141]|uniref:hypothetical protein n=1 Tax=Trueperella sp. LYQ141 TaxID=3391058 RepID=UPI003982EA6A